MNERDFKAELEKKLLVLLEKGNWIANIVKGVHELKYESLLHISIHTHTIKVVTAGYIVEMSGKRLVEKAQEVYEVTTKHQTEVEQEKLQSLVLSTMDKLTKSLEPV